MSLNRSQKGLVEQLRGITECSEKVAIELLRASEWNVDRAANDYFERGSAAPAPAAKGGRAAAAAAAPSAAKLEAEWARFEDPAVKGVMNVEQLIAFCGELGVDPESDVMVLLIAYNMGAKSMGSFTKEEFRRGFMAMGVDTVAGLKARLPALRESLKRTDVWKPFYSWAYEFNCEEGQKSCKMENVVALTPMFVTPDRWAFATQWAEFLRSRTRGTVTKDTWNALPRYIEVVKGDLSKHKEEDGWPVMLDEFVDWVRKRSGTASGAPSR